jgi:transcriptional regulator with XRE-family HTH domain
MTTERCEECGVGVVERRAVAGRKAGAFPGLDVELPADLNLRTCNSCLTWHADEDEASAVQAAIEQGQREWQRNNIPKLIADLRSKHNVTQQRIAATLGYTATYLSHVASGDTLAKSTLIRLLHAYVNDAALFRHHRTGKSLQLPTTEPPVAREASAFTYTVGSFSVSHPVRHASCGWLRESVSGSFLSAMTHAAVGRRIERPLSPGAAFKGLRVVQNAYEEA